MARPRAPCNGVWVPAITFFDPQTDKLCPREQSHYYRYLASTGITGLVILGTNAETFLLTRQERKLLVQLARQSVPEGFPIIAGVSGHSTAQVLEYTNDAYDAGADFALVLPCAYFGRQTTLDVVKSFYKHIANASKLPVIIYNFPAVCNGLDLESDVISDIARHQNVVGVKLTCGSVAKITRLAATFSPKEFVVFGGQSDFLIGGLSAGSCGCICAFGNIFPRLVVRIYDLWTNGQFRDAEELQRTVALAEVPTKAGISNTKYAAAIFNASKAGIKNAVELLQPRKPYVGPDGSARSMIEKHMEKANEMEIAIELEGAARLS